MPEIKDDDIKLANLINLMTFTIAKYAKQAGGVDVQRYGDSIVISLANVDEAHINQAFLKMLPEVANEPA